MSAGYLTNSSKINLFSDQYAGYLKAEGPRNREPRSNAATAVLTGLNVESLDKQQAPTDFEQAVFHVSLVDKFNAVRLPGDKDFSVQPVVYGGSVQLSHSYTQTVLCVQKRAYSTTEKSNFRVVLAKQEDVGDDKVSNFRVLSKYKLRMEGEKVRLSDQIILVPEGIDNRYLHISETRSGLNLYEVNCSFNPTSWTLCLYDEPNRDPCSVRLGEPTVLFHAEIESFLSAAAVDYDEVLAAGEDTTTRKSYAPVTSEDDWLRDMVEGDQRTEGELVSLGTRFGVMDMSGVDRGTSGGSDTQPSPRAHTGLGEKLYQAQDSFRSDQTSDSSDGEEEAEEIDFTLESSYLGYRQVRFGVVDKGAKKLQSSNNMSNSYERSGSLGEVVGPVTLDLTGVLMAQGSEDSSSSLNQTQAPRAKDSQHSLSQSMSPHVKKSKLDGSGSPKGSDFARPMTMGIGAHDISSRKSISVPSQANRFDRRISVSMGDSVGIDRFHRRTSADTGESLSRMASQKSILLSARTGPLSRHTSIGHGYEDQHADSLSRMRTNSFMSNNPSFCAQSTVIRRKMMKFIQNLDRGGRMDAGLQGAVFFMDAQAIKRSTTHQKGAVDIPSNSLWIIENENRTQGGPARFGVPYRLKHLATNSYFYIDYDDDQDQYTLTLTNDSRMLDHSSLFTFHPIDEDQVFMRTSEAFFRIQHEQTGLWLHCIRDLELDDSKRMLGGRSVTLLGLSERAYYQDVFSCGPKPSPSLVADLNHVLINSGYLSAYVEAFWLKNHEYRASHMSKVVLMTRLALTQLIQFSSDSEDQNPFSRAGVPIKEHQQMLLDQNVHKLIMKVLKCPFLNPDGTEEGATMDIKEIDKPSNGAFHIVCTLCYKLLKVMVAGTASFAMQVAEFIPYMQSQLPYGFMVADTLSVIFKDNKFLLEQVTPEVLRLFVTISNLKGSTGRYLNFLCELCVCDGVGIPKNQAIISESIFERYPDMLIPIQWSSDDGEVQVMIPDSLNFEDKEVEPWVAAVPIEVDHRSNPITSRDKDTSLKSLHTKTLGTKNFKAVFRKVRAQVQIQNVFTRHVASSRHNDVGLPRNEYVSITRFCSEAKCVVRQYLEVTLHLFSRLSIGNNDKTKAVIRNFIKEDVAFGLLGMHGPNNEDLPDNFRSKFYDIVTNCFFHPSDETGNRSSIKIWSLLDEKAQPKMGSEPVRAVLPIEDNVKDKAPEMRAAVPQTPLCETQSALLRMAEEAHARKFLDEMKEASCDLLAANTVMNAEQPDRSILLKSTLEMWRKFIHHKTYTQAELAKLLPIILDILDGRTDIKVKVAKKEGGSFTRQSIVRKNGSQAPRNMSAHASHRINRSLSHSNRSNLQSSQIGMDDVEWKKGAHHGKHGWNRYELTANNLLMMECKKVICDILSCLIDQYVDGTVDAVLAEFKTEVNRTIVNPEESEDTVPSSPRVHMDDLKRDSENIMSTLSSKVDLILKKRAFDSGNIPAAWDDIRSMLPLQKLIPILLDLTLYQHNRLVSDALTLLFRVYSFRTEFAKVLANVQLLFDRKTEATYQRVFAASIQLERLFESGGKLSEMEKMISFFNLFIRPPGEEEEDEDCSSLQSARKSWYSTFKGAYNRKASGAGIMQDQWSRIEENQDMFRNLGVWKTVVAICGGAVRKNNKKLLQRCYRFLTNFCMGNNRNQAALHDSDAIAFALKHVSKDTNVGADRLIAEIFADNYELASKVNEDIISTYIVQLMSPESKIHNIITFLKGLVVVQGMPVVRNQTLVMEALVELPSFLLPEHHQYIVSGQADRRMQEVMSLFVDLMAECCIGLNSSTELPAQQLLPTRLVFSILAEEKTTMPLPFMVPYCTFLREVWWVKEDGDSNSSVSAMQENPEESWMRNVDFWKVLQRFRDNVVEFNESQTFDDSVASFEEYGAYIFFGVIPCLTDFFENCWEYPADGVPIPYSIFNLVRKLTDALIDLLEDDERLDRYNAVHLDNLSRCLEAIDSVGVEGLEELEEQIIRCQSLAETLKETEIPDKPSLSKDIRYCLRQLQAQCTQKYGNGNTVDDLPAFTDVMYVYLVGESGDAYLTMLVKQMKESEFISQEVKKGVLRLFTQLIIRDRETDEDEGQEEKLCRMQVKMSSSDLGVTPLMTMLAERMDEVAHEAVDFGCELLQGGNAVAQHALLEYFSSADENFFENMTHKIQEATVMVRTRKREKLFLENAERKEILSSTHESTPISLLRILNILRLLQLFCEGHYAALQNYVRDQSDNLHSYNIINEVVTFLKEVVSGDMDPLLARFAIQTFYTLTEFCQGPCPKNQVALVECALYTEINILFEHNFDHLDSAIGFELRSSAVLTLLSVLEGCNDKSRHEHLANTVHFAHIKLALDHMWKSIEHGLQKGKMYTLTSEHDKTLDFAFNLFILMYVLHSMTDCKSLGKIITDSEWSGYMNSHLGVVEIARDYSVEKVYFRKPIICNSLADSTKQYILTTVNRDSPSSKLADFFEMADRVIYSMEYRAYIQNEISELLPEVPKEGDMNPVLRYMLKTARQHVIEKLPHTTSHDWVSWILGLAVCINVLIIADVQMGTYIDTWLVILIAYVIEFIIKVLALLAFLTNVCTIFSISILHVPTLLKMKDVKELKGQELLMLTKLFVSSDLPKRARQRHCMILGVLILTMMGMVNPIFFSVHLLLIIDQVALLHNVIQSVTLNGVSLLWTGIMGIVIIYLFTIVGFAVFPEDFTNDQGEKICNNLFQCLLFELFQGIRSGGGIGDLLHVRTFGDRTHIWRMVYDGLFFIIVILCLLNVVFGIVIDTFAQLRDQKNSIEEDTKKRCFICGIDSYEFDRHVEGGFQHHIHSSHNMWQYLYFMAHLHRKPIDDFTGQESYVHAKICKKDMGFFPLNKSLDLVEKLESSEQDTEEKDKNEWKSPFTDNTTAQNDLSKSSFPVIEKDLVKLVEKMEISVSRQVQDMEKLMCLRLDNQDITVRRLENLQVQMMLGMGFQQAKVGQPMSGPTTPTTSSGNGASASDKTLGQSFESSRGIKGTNLGSKGEYLETSLGVHVPYVDRNDVSASASPFMSESSISTGMRSGNASGMITRPNSNPGSLCVRQMSPPGRPAIPTLQIGGKLSCESMPEKHSGSNIHHIGPTHTPPQSDRREHGLRLHTQRSPANTPRIAIQGSPTIRASTAPATAPAITVDVEVSPPDNKDKFLGSGGPLSTSHGKRQHEGERVEGMIDSGITFEVSDSSELSSNLLVQSGLVESDEFIQDHTDITTQQF